MHLKCNDSMRLLWMDVAGKRFTDMNNDTTHSSETLTNWRNHIRQLYSLGLAFENPNNDVFEEIGGLGIQVQIDESLFMKNRGNVGRILEGQKWVFAGVEIIVLPCGKKILGKWFAVPVEDRTIFNLHAIIKEYIKPGSYIVSDGWSSYWSLPQIDSEEVIEAPDGTVLNHPLPPAGKMYTFDWVNHTDNFIDPETGVHTNGVEGLWSSKLKRRIPAKTRGPMVLGDEIVKWLWIDKHADNLWISLLNLLHNVRYDHDLPMYHQPLQNPYQQGHRALHR